MTVFRFHALIVAASIAAVTLLIVASTTVVDGRYILLGAYVVAVGAWLVCFSKGRR